MEISNSLWHWLKLLTTGRPLTVMVPLFPYLLYTEVQVVDFGFRGNECKFVNVPVSNGKPQKGTQSAIEAANNSKIFLVETQTHTIIFCNL